MLPTSHPRAEPVLVAPERHALTEWLEYHRATIVVKCLGLTADQLALRACPPSTLSLLGLVRHLTDVEAHWFRRVLDGQRIEYHYWRGEGGDPDFDELDPARAEHDLDLLLSEQAASRTIAERYQLDDVGRLPRSDPRDSVDLRWIYLHLIEEYARHAGHADLIRQAIDGATGE